MIKLRLFDPDDFACTFETPVFSAQWARSLSKSGPWTITLPFTDKIYDILVIGSIMRLYDGTTYCIGGRLQEKDIKNDADPVIEIKGREEIDSLYDKEANPILYPNEENFATSLFDILHKSGARFGLYKDLDLTRIVTVDLRREAQRLTQFSTLSRMDAGLFYRFGGYDFDDQLLIDVGYFQDPPKYVVDMPSSGEQRNQVVIQSNSENTDYTQRLYAARAQGGVYNFIGVGETEPRQSYAESDSALDADPTLAYDPFYPIYEEVVSNVYVVIPTSEGAIGGMQHSDGSPSQTFQGIGEWSGTGSVNYWTSFIFKPPPGLLTEVSFWTASVVGEANLKLLTFAYEVCEVNEVTPHIPGTVLTTGTIPASSWTANACCRVVIANPQTVTYDKRIMFRCGFTTTPANGNGIQLVGTGSGTNNARTMRMDRSNTRSSGYANTNGFLKCQAITTGTRTPVGRRALLQNSKIIPQQSGAQASTLAELEAAALTLYEWTVQQLELSRLPPLELPVTFAGLNHDWQPGDTITLRTQLQFPAGVRQVNQERTIETITRTFSDQQPKMAVQFQKLSTVEPDDPKVSLYESAKSGADIRWGQYLPTPKPWTLTELTQAISFRSPDTTLSDGTPAITVTFTVPAAPTAKGETQIIGTPYGEHTNSLTPIVAELVSKPPNALICKFAIRDVGWSVYDTATMYAHIVWR